MAEPQAITHRRVLNIALPIVLSNVSVAVLGTVDTAVVGQMGQAAPIGAVGIGAVVLTALYWVFGFLRMGTAGLTAQAIGAEDAGEVAALLSRALLIGLVGGVCLIALQVWIFAAAFVLSPASAEVEGLARDYMAIRIWGAPAAVAMFAVTGWLIAAERTRAVLAIALWMNGLNVGLNLWFVLGLGWGVQGVAWATLVAEWSGLAMGLWLCRAAFAGPGWRDAARVFDRVRLWHMALVNRDILIRSLLIESMFLSFLFLGAGFGDVPLAANQILLQFLHIAAFALDGFAFSAEALAGQAKGRRRRDMFRRAGIVASGWAVAVAALLSLAIALGGGAVIDVMTTSPEVRAEARAYLPWLALVPVVAVAAFMFDGIFVGATATREMRNIMAMSVVCYFIAVAALTPALGNHGLWMALLIAFAVRGVGMAARYPAVERGVA